MATLATQELLDLLYHIGPFAGAAAFVGLALLIPLYSQQSRDVHRLRDWSKLTPDSGTAEFQALESAGVTPMAAAPAAVRTDTAPMPTIPAAQRVARELPAATRTTHERIAVAPEPWWRRFVRRPEPRYLVAIVVGVVVLGVGVGVFAVQLRQESGPTTSADTTPGGVVPGDVDVAVLNATAVPGLAAKVGDDLKSGGFKIGAVTNGPAASQSYVVYERGHEREAQAVADRLGIDKIDVIDKEIEQIVAEGSSAVGLDPAAVVVVAGDDRATTRAPTALDNLTEP